MQIINGKYNSAKVFIGMLRYKSDDTSQVVRVFKEDN